jgi:hypothetical protein
MTPSTHLPYRIGRDKNAHGPPGPALCIINVIRGVIPAPLAIKKSDAATCCLSLLDGVRIWNGISEDHNDAMRRADRAIATLVVACNRAFGCDLLSSHIVSYHIVSAIQHGAQRPTWSGAVHHRCHARCM